MDKIVQYLIKPTLLFAWGEKLGSDLLKPYPSRHQTTPTVERPCSKGIETPALVRLLPVIFSRKTLPCSKGIETIANRWLGRIRTGRKTLPCSKGIETNNESYLSMRQKRRKTPPCSKGIETVFRLGMYRWLCRKTLLCSKGLKPVFTCAIPWSVERPRPVPKGLKLV